MGPNPIDKLESPLDYVETDPRRMLKPSEPKRPPTFDELCELESGLAELANTARLEHERSAGKDRYCSNEIWIWYLKPHLCALVGWGSRHPKPLMHTESAYTVAYHAIRDMLPDCRNCAADDSACPPALFG
jgi:hypothetical protein